MIFIRKENNYMGKYEYKVEFETNNNNLNNPEETIPIILDKITSIIRTELLQYVDNPMVTFTILEKDK